LGHFTSELADPKFFVVTSQHDAATAALKEGTRLLSAYHLKDGTKIWVITDAADQQRRRASTTAILPEEY
jgi:hypothetical protein